MSFDLKPTHPVKQPCCGGTKVDDIVWTEDRETLPEFLKHKDVSLELWQSTHDDVVFCVEINQCVGCHRAGGASMPWRTTR